MGEAKEGGQGRRTRGEDKEGGQGGRPRGEPRGEAKPSYPLVYRAAM